MKLIPTLYIERRDKSTVFRKNREIKYLAVDYGNGKVYNRRMSKCNLCPRKCGVERAEEVGYCNAPDEFVLSKIMLHHGEEPVISGTRGSGALFFSGCNLRCVYCQNYCVSAKEQGERISEERLKREIFTLVERGAHNINLVTAGHYAKRLIPVLEKIKPKLTVPIVYNTSAYESDSVIRALDGLIDVYLPDYKYAFSDLAKNYSKAEDYPEIAEKAIAEMLRQKPKCVIEKGLIKEGVIIRHLVLPGERANGQAVMEKIAEKFSGAQVSVMRQYTPKFNRSEYKNLSRKVTGFEYESVVSRALELGLDGYIQEKGCETDELTPDFSKIY